MGDVNHLSDCLDLSNAVLGFGSFKAEKPTQPNLIVQKLLHSKIDPSPKLIPPLHESIFSLNSNPQGE
jgi:hypothetical protein